MKITTLQWRKTKSGRPKFVIRLLHSGNNSNFPIGQMTRQIRII